MQTTLGRKGDEETEKRTHFTLADKSGRQQQLGGRKEGGLLLSAKQEGIFQLCHQVTRLVWNSCCRGHTPDKTAVSGNSVPFAGDSTKKRGYEMTKQMLCFSSTAIRCKSAFIKRRKLEAGLRRLLLQAGAPAGTLATLSVQGSMVFNTCLAAAIPEGAQVTRLPRGLREYRSEPLFDLLFYSVSPNGTDTQNLLQDLCYCRMLLRPGASLFLVTEGNGGAWVWDYWALKRRDEVAWFRRAGFMKITARKMDDDLLLFGGQRPLKNF